MDILCTGTAIIYGVALAVLALLIVLAFKREFKNGNANLPAEHKWSDYRIAVVCVLWVIGIRIFTMLAAHIAFGSGDILENMPNMWSKSTDVHHYMDIAQLGYQKFGESSLYIVFLPLFPYMLKAVGAITGEYFYTGSLMSCVFLVIACFYFFKTVRREAGERAAARALKYFMLFPSIFFAMMPMSEGLFLALAAMFLYFLRSHKFWAAAVTGMLAALTRSAGVILMLPFLAETAQMAYAKRPDFLRNFLRSSWPALLIPCGTVIYLAINYAVQGDALYFLSVQKEHWDQSFGFFTPTVKYVMEYLTSSDKTMDLCLWIPNMAAFTFGIGWLISATRHQRPMYLAYGISLFYFSMSVTWLLSGMRYALVLLPCFMEMGIVCNKRWKDIVTTAVMACGLLAYTLAFAGGGPVY